MSSFSSFFHLDNIRQSSKLFLIRPSPQILYLHLITRRGWLQILGFKGYWVLNNSVLELWTPKPDDFNKTIIHFANSKAKLFALAIRSRHSSGGRTIHAFLLSLFDDLLQEQVINHYWMRFSVIFRIIKGEVSDISQRLRLITLTETLIIMGITRNRIQ